MKALVAAFLLGQIWTVPWHELQDATRPDPVDGSNEGFPLKTVGKGYRVMLCAHDMTKTIVSGSATLFVQFMNGKWADDPTADALLVLTANGRACQAFPDFTPLVRSGRVLIATDVVVLSSTDGDNRIDVYMEAQAE